MHACIRTHRQTPGYILAEVHPVANNSMCGDDGNAGPFVPRTARLGRFACTIYRESRRRRMNKSSSSYSSPSPSSLSSPPHSPSPSPASPCSSPPKHQANVRLVLLFFDLNCGIDAAILSIPGYAVCPVCGCVVPENLVLWVWSDDPLNGWWFWQARSLWYPHEYWNFDQEHFHNILMCLDASLQQLQQH